jgi:hypothetical protein
MPINHIQDPKREICLACQLSDKGQILARKVERKTRVIIAVEKAIGIANRDSAGRIALANHANKVSRREPGERAESETFNQRNDVCQPQHIADQLGCGRGAKITDIYHSPAEPVQHGTTARKAVLGPTDHYGQLASFR